MQPETNMATTNTWLEVSKELKIKAYIESYTSITSIYNSLCPIADLHDELIRISIPFPKQRDTTQDQQLEMELSAWDTLSDEALIDFEQRL